ncbi:MAG: MTAP family purine nucleoside phosphorylase [Deltaproteobacteria bacterium]|nr:MTAP family purine nucleoside phosphorylase [Deltaproteobacteria bacterium]
MVGIIGGSSLFNSIVFEQWMKEIVETPYGEVVIKKSGNVVFLQRHGPRFLPPHKINHKANIWALKEKGIKKVIAINSTGSLKRTIKPGTFVIPNDFFCPWVIPTFFENECKFSIPVLDKSIIELLYELTKELNIAVKKGGIYVQTVGPRFETVAEINFLKKIGDIVGMTLASEATLCIELGIPYASLCSVDNYCHGISDKPLTVNDVEYFQKTNLSKIERFIEILIKRVEA